MNDFFNTLSWLLNFFNKKRSFMLLVSFFFLPPLAISKSDGIAKNIKDMNLLASLVTKSMYKLWSNSGLNISDELNNKIIFDNTGPGMIFDSCTLDNNSGLLHCITNSSINVHPSFINAELFIKPFFYDMHQILFGK